MWDGAKQKEADFSEIEMSCHSSYNEFFEKAAFLVGLIEGEEILSLFRPMQGSKILNEEITDRSGSLVPWSLGAYLARARKGAEKIAFGVGCIFQQLGVASTSLQQLEVTQSQACIIS